MNKWEDEIDDLIMLASAGFTMEEIGEKYGVSRQRVYQVFTKYGINTPLRKRKNFLKDKSPKYYWLNKMLCSKGISGESRNALLSNLTIPDKCPVFGIAIDYSSKSEGYSRNEHSPSLDQIVPGAGYVDGNIAIISWRANRLKNNGTADEHYKIAEWMKKVLQ